MNIVIVGMGTVGYTAAESLTKYHNVMVLELDPRKVEEVKNNLNVSILQEDATSPKILELALKIHSADVIISTTESDCNNLFISLICKHINPSIKTIARIKDPDYMLTDATRDGVVDQIITPEIMVGNKVAQLTMLENAVDFEDIESMELCMATFEILPHHTTFIGKGPLNLNIPPESGIIAVYRNGELIFDHELLTFEAGDVLMVLGSGRGVTEFNTLMGVQKVVKDVIISGGGVAGSRIASILEAKKIHVKVLEQNVNVCKELAKTFSNVTIINGSCVDPRVLESENIGKSDVLIATTNVDETNLLTCLMALKLGTPRVIARYTRMEYKDIFDFTGIRSNIGHHRIIANEITKRLISDQQAILRMKNPGELFFSIVVSPSAKVVGSLLGDIDLPEGARICCIIRGNNKIFPRIDTRLEASDKLLMFTYNANRRKLEKLFDVQLDLNVI